MKTWRQEAYDNELIRESDKEILVFILVENFSGLCRWIPKV